jgi:predicted DNA-binding transcriptional regulator AlpA
MKQEDAASTLGISISTLKRRYKRDANFPQPIKDGVGRQAHVYFVTQEIIALVQQQKDARNEHTA